MAEPRVNGGSNFDSLKVSAESVRWEGSEVRINGERTMGRQRREQWTAIDEDGVILSNFYTPCIFAFVGLKSVPYAHGHRRRVRGIFFFAFLLNRRPRHQSMAIDGRAESKKAE